MSVNYLIEIIRMDEWEFSHPISANAYKMWHKLLSIANMQRFPEWIKIPNARLTAMVGCTECTLAAARLTLIQEGLIEYKKKGKGKGATCWYRINYFSLNPDYSHKNYGNNDGENEGISNGENEGINNGITPGLNKTKDTMGKDVLLGRGRFTGETSNGTFAYEDDIDELPEDLFTRLCCIKKELHEEKKYLAEVNGAWLELCAYMTGEIGRDDLSHTMNVQFRMDQSLKEYMERATDEEAAENEPYGFISPDGEFHRVEWGEHGEWAETYIITSGLHDDYENNPDYPYPVDYLIHAKGWLLLHSPSNSKPTLTAGIKPLTKAQREALYDYYIKAGREEEANAIYREDG